MKIVCITPIKHLDEVYERLEQYGEVIYVPEISKLELLIDSSNILVSISS